MNDKLNMNCESCGKFFVNSNALWTHLVFKHPENIKHTKIHEQDKLRNGKNEANSEMYKIHNQDRRESTESSEYIIVHPVFESSDEEEMTGFPDDDIYKQKEMSCLLTTIIQNLNNTVDETILDLAIDTVFNDALALHIFQLER